MAHAGGDLAFVLPVVSVRQRTIRHATERVDTFDTRLLRNLLPESPCTSLPAIVLRGTQRSDESHCADFATCPDGAAPLADGAGVHTSGRRVQDISSLEPGPDAHRRSLTCIGPGPPRILAPMSRQARHCRTLNCCRSKRYREGRSTYSPDGHCQKQTRAPPGPASIFAGSVASGAGQGRSRRPSPSHRPDSSAAQGRRGLDPVSPVLGPELLAEQIQCK
jgi:hypothetical protein